MPARLVHGWGNFPSAAPPRDAALPDPRTLPPPAWFAAWAVSASRVELSWLGGPAELSATGIEVIRLRGLKPDKTVNLPASATSYADTTVSPDTGYRYLVRRVTAAGGRGVTSPAVAVHTSLWAPTGVTARRTSESQVNLTWDALPPGATGYEVWRWSGEGGDLLFPQHFSESPGDTSWSDAGLDPDCAYAYAVRAVNQAVGYSAFSETARTLAAPADLWAMSLPQSGVVAWPGVAGAATYQLQRTADQGETWSDVTAGTTETSVGVSLAGGDSLFFRARALGGGEVSPWVYDRLDVPAGDRSTPWPAGVSGGGRGVAADVLTRRTYVAVGGGGAHWVVEYDSVTVRALRKLGLPSPPGKLDVLWLDPANGGWLYGLEIGNRYVVQVNLTAWDEHTAAGFPDGVLDTAGACVLVLDLAAAGVTELSGGITGDVAGRRVYVSARGDGDPDLVELEFHPPGSGPGTLTVGRTLTLSGVGGTRAGALALDPAASRLYAATQSAGTTGRVAAVNIDPWLQAGQASFTVPGGQASYRTAGGWHGGHAYFAADGEQANLVRVSDDLSQVAQAVLPDFGWVRALARLPVTGELALSGQNTDTGLPEVRKVDLSDLADVGYLPFIATAPVLTATAVSPTRIDLAWTDPFDGEDGYDVWRSTSGVGGPFEHLRECPAGETTFGDTSVSPGTAYHYRVRARKVLADLADFLDPFGNIVGAFAPLAGAMYGFVVSTESGRAALRKIAIAAGAVPDFDTDYGGGGLDLVRGRDPITGADVGVFDYDPIVTGKKAKWFHDANVARLVSEGRQEEADRAKAAYVSAYERTIHGSGIEGWLKRLTNYAGGLISPEAEAADPLSAARGELVAATGIGKWSRAIMMGTVVGPTPAAPSLAAASSAARAAARAAAMEKHPSTNLSLANLTPDADGTYRLWVVYMREANQLYVGASEGVLTTHGAEAVDVLGFAHFYGVPGMVLRVNPGAKTLEVTNGSMATKGWLSAEEVPAAIAKLEGLYPEYKVVFKGSDVWTAGTPAGKYVGRVAGLEDIPLPPKEPPVRAGAGSLSPQAAKAVVTPVKPEPKISPFSGPVTEGTEAVNYAWWNPREGEVLTRSSSHLNGRGFDELAEKTPVWWNQAELNRFTYVVRAAEGGGKEIIIANGPGLKRGVVPQDKEDVASVLRFVANLPDNTPVTWVDRTHNVGFRVNEQGKLVREGWTSGEPP